MATTVSFVGTVVSCETRFETKVKRAIPVDFDARWIVTVTVESGDDAAPAAIGEQVSFLFHSPTQLFLADADTLAGRRYQFTIERTEEDGRLRWAALTAKRIRD